MPPQQPDDERLVALHDGAQVWTVTSGAGSPVVLCHGGPGLWDYLGDLAGLLESEHTVVRFDQRGCGRSSAHDGPFTLVQAVDDLEQVRQGLGIDRWAVVGHSWGAELALHYAARHPGRTTAVVHLAGVGAGEGFTTAYDAEWERRMGPHRPRWQELDERPRTPAEEQEWCHLQWRTDSSPDGDAAAHARAMWATRPAGAVINRRANRELWTDRAGQDLLALARDLPVPVLLVAGEDDPRPWTATDDLLAALPRARRVVLERAGHAPWVERPADLQRLVLQALPDA